MDCLLCKKVLDLYHEGNLSDGLQLQVKAHLENCSACARDLQLLILADQIVEEEKALQSNPFLVTRIMTGISEREVDQLAYKSISAHQRFLRPVLISLSLAAAVTIGIFLGNLNSSSQISRPIPVELSLMNDAALESVTFFSQQ